MRMMIKSDFGNDRDGYGLIEYLTMWANDLTQAEIKRIKRDIAAVTLRETDTPDMWGFKMQSLLKLWEQLPPGKRGGPIADLSDMLLDKVPASCATYVQYVRAFSAVNKKGLDDFLATTSGPCQHVQHDGLSFRMCCVLRIAWIPRFPDSTFPDTPGA